MVEQVCGDAAVVGPILSKAEKVFRVPRNFRGQSPLPTQPHIPINVILAGVIRAGGGINLLVLVKQASAGIPIIAGLRPGDLANAIGFDDFMRLPIRVVGRSVRANLKSLAEPLHNITELHRLLDRIRRSRSPQSGGGRSLRRWQKLEREKARAPIATTVEVSRKSRRDVCGVFISVFEKVACGLSWARSTLVIRYHFSENLGNHIGAHGLTAFERLPGTDSAIPNSQPLSKLLRNLKIRSPRNIRLA